MRFRFCGGLEPPDWLLAEIPLLAALDVGRVTDVCEKLSRGDEDEQQIEQSLGDVFATLQDATAATAALRFMLFQAAKYDGSDRELAIELLQLGLSSEIADTIAAVYDTQRVTLRKHLETRSFRFPTIEQLKWRVHPGHDGTDGAPSKVPRVEMRLQLDRAALPCDSSFNTGTGSQSLLGDTLAFTMSEDKFFALYEDLAQAQAILQSLTR